MTDERLDPTLRRHLDAYRASEPTRRRDPFADPRLAAIAAERTRRTTTPWYRRLVLAPAPAFAGAALALVLAFAPAGLPLAGEAEKAALLASPTLDAGAAPTDTVTPLVGTTPDRPAETPQLLLLGLAGALAALGLRRLARRS